MDARTVAPHAGAWIETPRGAEDRRDGKVAPHAGAWIETHHMPPLKRDFVVAPHAGAWIETRMPRTTTKTAGSRPTRARGLKQPADTWDSQSLTVAPHAGAWIETISDSVHRSASFVAPHAGAWIETVVLPSLNQSENGRAPRGRVD